MLNILCKMIVFNKIYLSLPSPKKIRTMRGLKAHPLNMFNNRA